MCMVVKIHFTAVGNAPIMKKNKFMVNGSDQLHVVRRRVVSHRALTRIIR